jgi:Ca-activated chloride channel family protein
MKLHWLLQSKKFAQGCAYTALGLLVAYGLIAHGREPKPITPIGDPPLAEWQQQGNVKVKANLSQTKVVQGSDRLVYMQVDLEAPESAGSRKERKATDFVVVLDRSGSMADAKKMDFAHKAIESLLNQLTPNDRFGLITFDDSIETPVELSAVTKENRDSIISRVNSITPRGSTNLGGGLIAGMDLIRAKKKTDHADRLLLISDGIANVGITDPKELGRVASRAVGGEFAVSTIGVGLDFNENVMASIADSGNGNYHFLENLASLDKVLSDEFYGASQVYGSDLKVKINLASGVELMEASGYPVTQEGRTATIQPGHLYGGQKKTFFITFRIPTDRAYSQSLGEGVLNYQAEGKSYSVQILKEDLKVACVPREREQEALNSIVPSVYKEAWTKNNFGRFLKENADSVNKGDQGGALGSIQGYKEKLSAAYRAAPAPEMKKQLEELDKMATEVNGAFSSPDKANDLKRLGKTYQYEGIQNQRKAN